MRRTAILGSRGAHPLSKPPVTFNHWLVRDFTFPFTPLFEAAIGDVCDYKTDNFACGKVAYHLLLQDEGNPFDCAWEGFPAFLEAWSSREELQAISGLLDADRDLSCNMLDNDCRRGPGAAVTQ